MYCLCFLTETLTTRTLNFLHYEPALIFRHKAVLRNQP